MNGVEALIGIRMQNTGCRNPPIQQWVESISTEVRALAATDLNAPPQSAYALPENAQLARVTGHRMVLVVTLHNLPKPHADLTHTMVLPVSHTAQSLGHSFPALCRARVGLYDVLLSLRPSLPDLRRGLPLLVRPVQRYYGTVRLLLNVHVRILVYAFADRLAGSRACCFSACAGSNDYAGPNRHSRLSRPPYCLPPLVMESAS
jgi:hypothetical protein